MFDEEDKQENASPVGYRIERKMMSKATRAEVGDTTVKCPVCGGQEFRGKKYQLAGTWLQTFDMEGFGRDALMLICENCGHVLHFARREDVKMSS
jgi:predicted nucleic-acid-binding Zn-ribbon protein